MEKLALNRKTHLTYIGAHFEGNKDENALCQMCGLVGQAKKCQGDPPNGLNFPIYVVKWASYLHRTGGRGFLVTWKEMGKV